MSHLITNKISPYTYMIALNIFKSCTTSGIELSALNATKPFFP